MSTLVRNKIFLENPYTGFDDSIYPVDLQGWGHDDPNFEKVIKELRPTLIIEVGTWKGASAIEMSKISKRNGIQNEIVCVDTWLGSLEFVTKEGDEGRATPLENETFNEIRRGLARKYGYPGVYYQFLANILRSGNADVITPFPQTSTIAARFFVIHNIQASLIYLDGSHDEKDVYEDIENYWKVLSPGGIMIGDDYNEWVTVKKAVDRFAKDSGLTVEISESRRQWMMRKLKC
jgi:SAM-dependent methyltransferase